MRITLAVAILLAACAPRDEQPVAKRDTGVAEARVTTESPARGQDSAVGVPAVPTDSAQRSAAAGTKERVVRFDPPPESLKVKP